MSTPKKAAKAAPTKTEPKVTDSTAITFKSPRPNDAQGPKTKLLALVPRKGSIKFAALKAKAEAEKLNVAKAAQWIASMAKNGRVELS
jgi:hypothetical protein